MELSLKVTDLSSSYDQAKLQLENKQDEFIKAMQELRVKESDLDDVRMEISKLLNEMETVNKEKIGLKAVILSHEEEKKSLKENGETLQTENARFVLIIVLSSDDGAPDDYLHRITIVKLLTQHVRRLLGTHQ